MGQNMDTKSIIIAAIAVLGLFTGSSQAKVQIFNESDISVDKEFIVRVNNGCHNKRNFFLPKPGENIVQPFSFKNPNIEASIKQFGKQNEIYCQNLTLIKADKSNDLEVIVRGTEIHGYVCTLREVQQIQADCYDSDDEF